MPIQLTHKFEDIISLDNLLAAWQEFIRGKKHKRDVQEFALRLMDNLIILHHDLITGTYRHGGYQAFNIFDPKPRHIHKASVRDRLLHHAIHRILYPFFDKTFIADSYSCRLNKGTHRALNRFRQFGYQVSHNNTKTGWILKCDIKKFFASIDQEVLLNILKQRIDDDRLIELLKQVIDSFCSLFNEQNFTPRQARGIKFYLNRGLPLGNLTSQLLANIYMNEFDRYIKHRLKIKYYLRYADDFVILSEDSEWLEKQIINIKSFLNIKLRLELHPQKVFIRTLASGVDFLGWVHFPDHRVWRTATKKRMIRRLKSNQTPETLNSYLGLLKWGNGWKIIRKIY